MGDDNSYDQFLSISHQNINVSKCISEKSEINELCMPTVTCKYIFRALRPRVRNVFLRQEV